MSPPAASTKPHRTPPGRLGWLVRRVDGSYIDRSACDAAFVRMHRQDAIGDRIHLIFACIGCVGLLGPQTVLQIAMAPLVVFFVVRILNTFPIWIHGFGQPAVLVTLALAGWMGVTLLWSGNIPLGLEEISKLRWMLLVGFLYPIIEKRTVLIWALLVGFGLAMLAQVVDAFDGFGYEPLAEYFWHDPKRISGWYQPVVGGSLFVAGLGLVLPSALFDRGRLRVFSIGASSLMAVSIIATGSRGAWIAMVLLAIVIVSFGVLTKRVRVRTLLSFGCLSAIVLVAVFAVGGSTIRDRATQAQSEIADAFNGQYNSDTGARIRMAQLAARATLEHPIGGVGAGGYKQWARPLAPEEVLIHDHAHNTPLQLSATTGLVGLGIAGLLVLVLLRNGKNAANRFGASGFAIGPVFGIVGLAMVSMTDVVLINAQTAALLGMLAALSPAYVPELPNTKERQTV
ncbi:MAG: O-antigen ligase family protein [Phycisphaerales bacterium]|nr:O-antigen ligase family protein [Phycisphaerales bacterium]